MENPNRENIEDIVRKISLLLQKQSIELQA